MQNNKKSDKETLNTPIDKTKILAEIDGYYIVKVDTPRDLDREGKLMKNFINKYYMTLLQKGSNY